MERWIPYPVCAWAGEDEAAAALADLERRRPPAPPPGGAGEGARGSQEDSGEVVVVSYPGDHVVVGGHSFTMTRDGTWSTVAGEEPGTVTLVGGGEARSAVVTGVRGHVTWLRFQPPAERWVLFGVGSAEISQEWQAEIAAWVRDTAGWSWELHGAFSPEGSPEANLALAEQRAAAVGQAMVALGLPPARIIRGAPLQPDPALSAEVQRAVILSPIPPEVRP